MLIYFLFVLKDGEIKYLSDELNLLVDKTFLFKISVTAYNMKENYLMYTVCRMSDNSWLIESFNNLFTEAKVLSHC